MKKLSLILSIFMFCAFTMLNANTKETYIEDGRASDCARMARATVMALAEFVGDDVNGANLEGYLVIYKVLYTDCLNN